MKTLSLFELNNMVATTLAAHLSGDYWVEAELSEVREQRGHCYMELIQKSPDSDAPIARSSAKCWKNVWLYAKPYFENATGQSLHVGMKVRLQVYANFHEAYGFSWIVSDIDPYFTMGEQARKRQEIIETLKSEGIFDMQKQLTLPLFAQRIAVISSPTAAGYGDFCNQLANNEQQLKFSTTLFPATMQGEQTVPSIIKALNDINDNATSYDVVVIIRGGGATSDLTVFDSLPLAENIANFPLPVITGIGHDRDECILDMISHTRVKTPTAAAAFLIDHLQAVATAIDDASSRMARYVAGRLSTLNLQLSTLNAQLSTLFANVKMRQNARLDTLFGSITYNAQKKLSAHTAQLSTLNFQLSMLTERRLLHERHRCQQAEEKLKSLDPALVLSRGYSITMKDGKAIKDAHTLQPGDIIETRLAKGTIRSEVK